MNRKQGQNVVRAWALVEEGEVAKQTETVLEGDRFAILATESEAHQRFTRVQQVRVKMINK